MALKRLPVFFLIVGLFIAIAVLSRASSSYAQSQQRNSRPQSTPAPASLDVKVMYPSDGILSPGKSQVVRASITIGAPRDVPVNKYRVVTRIRDANGNPLRSHAYHPAKVQSIGQVGMGGLPPGDYIFSTELYSAGTMIAQSGTSRIKKTARPKPTPSPTATPSGTPTPSPVPGYATTWLGNSFGLSGFSENGGVHVQQQSTDMTVSPSGAAFLNSRWDEGHNYMGKYHDGQYVRQMDCPWTFSTGTSGAAITNNGTYIYATQNTSYASPGQWTNFLGRWNLDGTAAAFSGGAGNCGNLETVDASPNGTKPLWGVAASSTEVYVTDAATNQVKVYDANTMAFKRSWSFTTPRRIAYDPNTTSLWISQGTDTQPNQLFVGNIYHEDINGNQLSGTITSVARPTALVMQGATLWVGDDGPDQQIKEFNSSGIQVGTFGVQGGYLSGTPGVVAANKLFRPNGVGFDSSNNIYVLGAGSSLDGMIGVQYSLTWSNDIREYDSGGALLSDISAPGSFDDNAVADSATDGEDFYSALNHYKFNYGNLTTGSGGGGKEWSWYSHTMDPFTYPHDPRQYQFFPNVCGVQTIGGNKYLAVTDQYSHQLMLFKMTPEIAKPMAVFASWWPGTGPWWPNQTSPTFLWQDTNNNGEPDEAEFTSASPLNSGDKWWDFDTNGDVWLVNFGSGIGRFPMQGINANGQLTYSTSAYSSYGVPAPFTSVSASQYDAANDIMYVSGYTAALPPFNNESTAAEAGTVIARFNGFLAYWNAHGTWPAAAWTANLPHVYSSNWFLAMWVRAWRVAGNRVFAGLERTQYNSSSPNQTVTHNIYVYDNANGGFLGEMMPGVETKQMMGWIDQNQDLSAYQRSNGEYVITEEEQHGAKQTVLRGMLNDFTQY